MAGLLWSATKRKMHLPRRYITHVTGTSTGSPDVLRAIYPVYPGITRYVPKLISFGHPGQSCRSIPHPFSAHHHNHWNPKARSRAASVRIHALSRGASGSPGSLRGSKKPTKATKPALCIRRDMLLFFFPGPLPKKER